MEPLPLETKKHLLAFLDDRSRLKARLACIEWFKIIKYDDFKILFCDREMLAAVIERMSKYAHPIGLTFPKSRFNLDWEIQTPNEDRDQFFELSRLTHLTKLEIPEQSFDWPDWSPFTILTNLQALLIVDDQDTINSIYPSLPSLTKSSVSGQLRCLTAFTNLQDLEVFLDFNESEIIERLKFPERLTSLAVYSIRGQGTLKMSSVTLLTGLKSLEWSIKSQQFPHDLLPNLESLDRIVTRD